MVITFRDSETEANGIVEKVRYEVRDKTVLVTYLEGMAKGMTMHYTLTGPDTAVTNLARCDASHRTKLRRHKRTQVRHRQAWLSSQQ